MRRPANLLIPLLLIGGCMAETTASEPAGTAAAQAAPVSCINLDQVIARRPAGPQAILFELTGGRAYHNDLPDHCPGLERAGTAEVIAVEATGTRLCRNDRVRIFDPVEARNIGLSSFPRCRLGAFQPVAADRRRP